MKHLVTLKEGYENMVGITGVENKIESNGNGIAYGAEFMLKKKFKEKWLKNRYLKMFNCQRKSLPCLSTTQGNH
jgi:hypothetical protein